MKNISVLLFLLLAAVGLMGQSEISTSINNLSIEAASVGGFFREGYIEGTPYSSEEKSEGIFYQKNSSVVKTPTKLNYCQNSFEFEKDGKIYILAANSVDSVVVGGETFEYRTFEVYGKKEPRVVKVIGRTGKNTLFLFTQVEFKPEVKAGGYIDPKPARYEWDTPVYFMEIGDKLIALDNFKELIASFTGKENDVKKFIKENKIRKDKPEELKKLLSFITKL